MIKRTERDDGDDDETSGIAATAADRRRKDHDADADDLVAVLAATASRRHDGKDIQERGAFENQEVERTSRRGWKRYGERGD